MVRDFTETTEEELLQLIGDKQDELENGNINYYGMKYNTETIDSDYVVLFQEINESVDAIVGNITALQIYNEQLQETVQTIFSDARAKDEEWAEEVVADIPEIMENYLGNLNTLIESISCKSVAGTASQVWNALYAQNCAIFGDEDSFKENFSDVKSLAQRCFEELKSEDTTKNFYDYSKIYDLLHLNRDEIELWQMEALMMVLNSYVVIEENNDNPGTKNINLASEELEKFLEQCYVSCIPEGEINTATTETFKTTDVFKDLAKYFNVNTYVVLNSYERAIQSYDEDEMLYLQNIAYVNGIIASVDTFYEYLEVDYTSDWTMNLKFNINPVYTTNNISNNMTQDTTNIGVNDVFNNMVNYIIDHADNSNDSDNPQNPDKSDKPDNSEKYVEKVIINVERAKESNITVYNIGDIYDSYENYVTDVNEENVVDPDTVYMNTLGNELQSVYHDYTKNMTKKNIIENTIGKIPVAGELLLKTKTAVDNAERAYNDAVANNEQCENNVKQSRQRKLISDLRAECTLAVYGTETDYMVTNFHFDRENLEGDVAYYNAYAQQYNASHDGNPKQEYNVDALINAFMGEYGLEKNAYLDEFSRFDQGSVSADSDYIPHDKYGEKMTRDDYVGSIN